MREFQEQLYLKQVEGGEKFHFELIKLRNAEQALQKT